MFNDISYHSSSHEHPDPPYLKNTPDIINITIGRQLFVDDYLIENMYNTKRIFNPAKHKKDIITPKEKYEGSLTAPLTDSVIYDPFKKIYRMWYVASGSPPFKLCIAESTDGLQWKRKMNIHKNCNHPQNIPIIDPCCASCIKQVSYWNKVNHNILGSFGGCKKTLGRGSGSIILDIKEKDPKKRYKLLWGGCREIKIYYSPDGIHWVKGPTGGFIGGSPWYVSYNPFRGKYIFTMRDNLPHIKLTRLVRYKEVNNLTESWPKWFDVKHYGGVGYKEIKKEHPQILCVADKRDTMKIKCKRIPGLYCAVAVPYESIMIFLMAIYRGGETTYKHVDIYIGFSRDGIHYTRYYKPFIEELDNYQYLIPTGGNITMFNELLQFYYLSYTRDRLTTKTSVATLRRDGFACIAPINSAEEGWLLTKKVKGNGSYLFINVDVFGKEGYILVELISKKGDIIKRYSKETCNRISKSSTKTPVKWRTAFKIPFNNLSFRIKFYFYKAKIYSFWISKSEKGASGGYIGSGGKDYNSFKDV